LAGSQNPHSGDATRANPPKVGDAKQRGYRAQWLRATPAEPPNSPRKEGFMRLIHRMVTASFVVVTATASVSCERDATSPANVGLPETLRVSLAPKFDTLVTGATRQLTARVSNTLNEPRDHAVDWRSENPSVASVSTSGLVAAIAPGTARITASAGGPADTATLVVIAQAPPITITPGAVQVILGDTLRLVLSSSGTAGSVAMSATAARWASSDSSIASVSADGVVTSVDEGFATITAQASGTTATADVQVVKSPVSSVTVSPPNASIYPADNLQLTATAYDSRGRVTSKGNPSWVSSNSAVATVSGDGLVTGVAKGVAIIAVEIQKKKATATVTVLDVPAASVTVALTASTLSVGQTTQATATIKDASGTILTGRIVAWQSSNPALATVNSAGLVTAVAKGSVTISAICDGKVGGASLTVAAPTPASIAITPSGVSLTKGQSTQLSAQVLDANGAVIPNRPVAWSTMNSAVAAVTSAGAVTGVNVGSTAAQATADGLTASASVAVTDVPAASVAVSPTTLAMLPGDTARVSAVVKDANGNVLANRGVNWSSSNAAVASVAATGTVTAVAAGSATITAQVDGVTATTTVTVSAPPPAPVASVAVTVTPSSLTVGQTAQSSVTLRDAAGNVLSGRSVTWSSANPSVATVSASGIVTAVSAGSASIVATSEGQTGAATETVDAPAPSPVATITLSASSTTLSIGATMQVVITLKDAAGNVLTGRTIGWTSSNTAIATVSATGVVRGVSAGAVVITASSEGKTATIDFTISPAPVAAVSVTLSSGSLLVGQTTQATARLTDASGNVLTGRSIVWSSSVPAVATISQAGVVSALAAGSASIVATSEGKSGSAPVSVTAPTVSNPPPASCSLVTDLNTYPTSSFSKPGYLVGATEPDFRTTFTRITGDPGTPIGNGVSGNWPDVARLYYAKDQPWSADGKLLMISEMNGAVGPGGQLFLDGDTYKPLFARSHPGPEARWHPTLADVMIYVMDNGSVGHWNARTNSATLKFTTSAYRGALLGPWEGNPSGDGRYVAVTATRVSDGKLVVYVVDIQDGTKGTDLDVLAQGISSASDLDWASVSQGGGYVVLFGRINGAVQTIKVYNRATMALVAYYGDHPLGHFDLGIDAAGNEVAFGAASAGTYSKRFIMRRLDNGQVTPLTPPTTWDWHSSTRAYRRPGWGLAVTNDAAGSIFDREIYWVKLDNSGTVQRVGHHRTKMTDYNASPFAVPSPDGKRIAFGSNWGASSGRPVQTYVIDTRAICP
jgi:uncharacterized protein YjdB